MGTQGAENALPFKHSAERSVWHDLVATFEPVIDEVFSTDCQDVVNYARHVLTPET